MNQLPIQRLPLSLIRTDDHSFRLLPFDEPPDEGLRRHVQRAGILHPPLVKEQGSGNYLLVGGGKRLTLVREVLKASSCDCLVIPPDFDPLATLALALDEALASGPLSPLVRACFLKKVLPLCPAEEAARRFLPLLGLPPQGQHLRQLTALAELEEPLAQALHRGQLEEKTALVLCGLSFRDRFALFDLIATLRLGAGSQRKAASLCQALAQRQGLSIHALLASPECQAIISQPQVTPHQRAAAAIDWLEEQLVDHGPGTESS